MGFDWKPWFLDMDDELFAFPLDNPNICGKNKVRIF